MRKKHRLAWVDDFLRQIKPYVYLRLRDNVLIRMPNEAFKLNTTGARIVAHILSGGSVLDIIKARADAPETEEQLERFFLDLTRMWNHEICDNYITPAIIRREFTLGYIELPVLSEVAVTSACNIKCRFCYAGCTENKKANQLDLKGFKKVLDIIRYEAEVPSVSFTGGEPLLFAELTDLIKYAAQNNGMRVNLITNGTLISGQKARELARAGLASAQVSIESACQEEHDAISGVPGSHDASVAGLQALKEAGVSVHPHITINRLNKEKVADYPEFVRRLGIERFSANLVIPAGRGADAELKVSYTEIGEIIAEIRQAAAAAGVEFMWYSPTPICLFNPVAAGFGNKGCSACEGLLSVDAQGNVLPCSSWPMPLGNLLTEGFTSIWYQKQSVWIRQKKAAPPLCKKCQHFALCQGACPLYFQSHGYGDLESYWQACGLLQEGGAL
ncbi:MAG: radical SAM protein [Firmicutes bacterium]|nr:radical SAM protein [Bacillota bacterium]